MEFSVNAAHVSAEIVVERASKLNCLRYQFDVVRSDTIGGAIRVEKVLLASFSSEISVKWIYFAIE